jgi:TonB family protein
MWLMTLMLLWSIVTGVVAGSLAHSGAGVLTYPTAPPDAGPRPPPTLTFPIYTLNEVDQPPELANQGEVKDALSRNYPPLLRDAGVTGRATVRFAVTELGEVEPSSLTVVSASAFEFGAAALRVARTMRFWPARKNARPVSVWVTLPVTFALQNGP